MSDERKQILQMLAEGKITVDEAEKLLEAVGEQPISGRKAKSDQENGGKIPKYLSIRIKSKDHGGGNKENVNIRIPLMLIKAGVKLGSLIPGKSKAKLDGILNEKGLDIDLGNLADADLDELIKGLSGAGIRVDDDNESVRIRCGYGYGPEED